MARPRFLQTSFLRSAEPWNKLDASGSFADTPGGGNRYVPKVGPDIGVSGGSGPLVPFVNTTPDEAGFTTNCWLFMEEPVLKSIVDSISRRGAQTMPASFWRVQQDRGGPVWVRKRERGVLGAEPRVLRNDRELK